MFGYLSHVAQYVQVDDYMPEYGKPDMTSGDYRGMCSDENNLILLI